MRHSLAGATMLFGLLAAGAPASAGELLTSPMSVLNGSVVQCAVANYRAKPAPIELNVICNGVDFLGPAVRDVQPGGRGVVFRTNNGPNQLCYCAIRFGGSGGQIRGVLQVFPEGSQQVVQRGEAR